MAARKTVDEWARIEREYLAGEDSIREIADRHEVSEAAIRKRAKQNGWEREVRRREKVRTLTPLPVRVEPRPYVEPAEPKTPTAIADHGRQLVGRMYEELDAITSYQGELEEAIELATVDDEDDRRRDAMLKAVSLPARSMIAKNLATALKTINESSAPQGKKAAQQERATAVGRKFGRMGAPTSPGKTLN